MIRLNAKDVKWQSVEVLGKPGLFVDFRIDRNTIPEGYHFYEVRHDDNSWGDPVEIALGILVNFLGTLIMKEPLDLEPAENGNNFVEIDPEKDWWYLGEDNITLGES